MNQKEARKLFNADIKPAVVKMYSHNDTIALNEAFNDWIDSMARDRQITQKQADSWTRS